MPWLTGQVPALALALCLLAFAGVVLPAVWSTHPARRQAAAAVLAQFLAALRGPGRTGSSVPTPPPWVPPARPQPATGRHTPTRISRMPRHATPQPEPAVRRTTGDASLRSMRPAPASSVLATGHGALTKNVGRRPTVWSAADWPRASPGARGVGTRRSCPRNRGRPAPLAQWRNSVRSGGPGRGCRDGRQRNGASQGTRAASSKPG